MMQSDVDEQGVAPQSCPSCGTAAAAGGPVLPPAFVYAIGRIEPRFPRASVQKEFAQATARGDSAGLTDHQSMQKVLLQNRYLVRELCWVMTIGGVETYILLPRDPADYSLLVEALRATPKATDLDVVIGVRGPLASPQMCNGLLLPVVAFDQIYSFDSGALIKAIPRPEKTPAKEFAAAAKEVFERILQTTDNAGFTDEHRSLNYLAVRYGGIYANAAEAFARNSSLYAVEVRPWALGGPRKILEVILSFTNRSTDVTEKSSVLVDATDKFLYLVRKLSPYFDR